MALEPFAELHVRDLRAARVWYVRLLGEPSFVAHDTEEVWELAEHRSIAVEERPQHAGHGAVTVIVDDLDARVDGIVARGNEVGFGGAPA